MENKKYELQVWFPGHSDHDNWIYYSTDKDNIMEAVKEFKDSLKKINFDLYPMEPEFYNLWKRNVKDGEENYMGSIKEKDIDVFEERIQRINKAAMKKEKKRIKEEQEALSKHNNLIKQIENLSTRIQNLIKTVRYCVNCRIEIPRKFIAEGIYHYVGFINGNPIDMEPDIKYIGIINGGACGQYDFHTNGNMIFSIHEDTKEMVSPKDYDMEKFLKEFDAFESAFYNFIDSLEI